MNSGNVILMAVGAVLAGLFFMLSDTPKPAPSGGMATNSQLRSAMASGQPVLLEFYADWCGPCRSVGPIVDEFAREVHGKAKVLRFNVDQHGDLAQEYGVRGIPAFIAFKHGRESAREVGAIDKSRMKSMLGM